MNILNNLSRRDVLLAGVAGAAALSAKAIGMPTHTPRTAGDRLFTISLAQWSLHRELQSGKLDHLDFPKVSKQDLGIDAVEYVNTFFKKPGDAAYTKELKKRCDDLGVTSVLIMCDGEGDLGAASESARAKTVDNHVKWLDAAKALGCHSIRVNAASTGTREEQASRAADGLRKLCDKADPLGLNVIVENHGGLSSDAAWLTQVIKMTGHARAGTLPDFGNFPKEADRVKSVEQLMTTAKAVSAKSYDFDPATGDHTSFDFRRLVEVVIDAGYRGRIGIEYEGSKISEREGIKATKKLLEKLHAEFLPSKTEGP